MGVAATAVIDATARIADTAVIGEGSRIGPYCVIGPDVVLGDNAHLEAHVHLTGATTIGPRAKILPFTSLGTPPQSARYRGGKTRLVIGADCDIREGVTMNTGTEDGGALTTVGDRCLFMAGAHVGHDCHLADEVTLANGVLLGGHVEVGRNVFFGGGAKVHQFVRVGERVMVMGGSGLTADAVPFALVEDFRAVIGGINVVGLRRAGFSRADLHRVRDAYRVLFGGPGDFKSRRAQFIEAHRDDALLGVLAAFLVASAARPLMQAGRGFSAGGAG